MGVGVPVVFVIVCVIASSPGAVAMDRPVSKARAQARYVPTLRNHRGRRARHVCHSRESYYFDDHGKRHLIGDYCTRGFASLSLRSGELLSLRTARAAKRVDLMPLDSLGDLESRATVWAAVGCGIAECGRAGCHAPPPGTGTWRCRSLTQRPAATGGPTSACSPNPVESAEEARLSSVRTSESRI